MLIILHILSHLISTTILYSIINPTLQKKFRLRYVK